MVLRIGPSREAGLSAGMWRGHVPPRKRKKKKKRAFCVFSAYLEGVKKSRNDDVGLDELPFIHPFIVVCNNERQFIYIIISTFLLFFTLGSKPIFFTSLSHHRLLVPYPWTAFSDFFSDLCSLVCFIFLSVPAGWRKAEPCRYCSYSVVQKWVFVPQGRRVAHKREIWHEQTAGPLPRAKFHVYRGRNVWIQPPKLSKFRILAINLCLWGDSFAVFLRNSQRSYASVGSF